MAGQTISAHIDEAVVARLKEISRVDSRATSQLIGTALKSFVAMQPSARRVAFSVGGSCTKEEQEFVARALSRSMLKAYQSVIEARQLEAIREKEAVAGTNVPLLTEEDIEDEAVRACRM